MVDAVSSALREYSLPVPQIRREKYILSRRDRASLALEPSSRPSVGWAALVECREHCDTPHIANGLHTRTACIVDGRCGKPPQVCTFPWPGRGDYARPALEDCRLVHCADDLERMGGEGRIAFSGAIKAPTCEASDGSGVMAAGNGVPDPPFTCAGRMQATVADPSACRISVSRLDGATAAGNLLLQYFADYHAPSDITGVQRVTRVYE